ncbi:MAG: hypothetical protein APF77_02780 [Clostridia bacterium BRH_c25]|nr:MAG: hypothetical protein APF77_02780 [Clostridia bacterium BRH_c25]
MRQVVGNLRRQEYVNASNVEALRKYIRVRNPNISKEEFSAVFADALHKIIDTRISQFEEKHRKKIKDDVLRKAVKKKDFSINAAEVFTSCLSMKLREDSYINNFTQWINQNQPVTVSAGNVDKLVSRVEQLEEEYIENNLEEIFNEFEAGGTEDEVLVALESRLIKKVKEFCFKYVKPSMKLVLPAALPLVIITAFVFADQLGDNRIHALQHQDQGKYANIAEEQVDRYLTLESRVLKKLGSSGGEKGLVLLDGLHDELRYEEVDRKELKKWLDKKNSMLSEEPYFTAIIATSEKYDIHPLLMFAIVGQEQAFVPKSGAAAKKIANNPFNVYGSWEKYNTDIYDSSRLAADTIIKSSRNRPAYMNTIKWINRRYAEDPNWWNGVSMLFTQMEKEIAN